MARRKQTPIVNALLGSVRRECPAGVAIIVGIALAGCGSRERAVPTLTLTPTSMPLLISRPTGYTDR